MPTDKKEIVYPSILYSCYAHRSREGEQFVPSHVFGFMIAGTSDMVLGDQPYHFKAGDYRFIRKNQLVRYTKYPPAGGEYRSLSVMLDEETLRGVARETGQTADRPYTGPALIRLMPNQLLEKYIASLDPYLNGTTAFNQSISILKAKEAVMLLLETNPSLKNVLFDFSPPGKIDLEAYMSEHYRFRVDLARFAYLTGRSLASFKRDFEKIFHMSPNRWLQEKRLTDAHYLIREKGMKSSDVYQEVGFKDFSHFSFAFKKAYGVSPSRLT